MLRSMNWAEMAVPIAVLCIVMAMITPLPSILLDVLISANITMSVIVLMSAMYITKPSEFSIYPTMLLLLTLFRLALNISSSRLILLNGNTGTRAAGDVIESFGNFVVGGNYVVGIVIFLVLLAIQYVVINHGAVRISEVTARFTLDAMPGKQMSIDSDLNSGLIDEQEARRRRKELAGEAEFYGAMDGASRFTQRDAVASIIITTINIMAGFLIGVLQHGVELSRALQTYTILTIGDGLVTVIPALMISVSGGLIVTRASSESRLSLEVKKQIFTQAQPLMLAAGVLIALAAFPGLPKIPFLVLGAGAGYGGWTLRQREQRAKLTAATTALAAKPKEDIEGLLKVEPVAIEVGLGLVRFVEGGLQSILLKRIAGIRRQFASEMGYLLPPVRVTDNVQLKAREYVVLVKGMEVARYELHAGCEMAIQPAQNAVTIPGTATREPAFNMPAVWVTPGPDRPCEVVGLYHCGPVVGVGDALHGGHQAVLLRTVLTAGCQARARPSGPGSAEAGGRFGAEAVNTGCGAEGLPESAARTRGDQRRRDDSGGHERRFRNDAECEPAFRVRPPGRAAIDSEAAPERGRRFAGVLPGRCDRANDRRRH